MKQRGRRGASPLERSRRAKGVEKGGKDSLSRQEISMSALPSDTVRARRARSRGQNSNRLITSPKSAVYVVKRETSSSACDNDTEPLPDTTTATHPPRPSRHPFTHSSSDAMRLLSQLPLAYCHHVTLRASYGLHALSFVTPRVTFPLSVVPLR